ncbi:putative retrotransposon nucleocapsid protein [Puccinia sorghi]|uniref:Putative retrotransposon nucleocapsid protein n=1 Tax=Puccinia sorghi TaxID=27349 RepID=A0A0L6VSZ5_9BASI|nr:putative retrotransposon nucleocapsid protein [Puccinia sorghi]
MRTRFGSFEYTRFMSWYISMISSSIPKLSTIMFEMFEKCLIVFKKTVCVIVSSDCISMDPAKCQKVLDWPQPLSVKTLQGSWTIVNLTSLLQKDTTFLFTEQASKEFEALKKAFTTAPILAHFSELAQTLIETNASDYAVAGVISHLGSYITPNSTTRFMTRNF